MYRWVDHTAELELQLESETAAGVLGDALAAFAELVGGAGAETAERLVEVDAPDLDALLVSWLDELVYLADRDAFVPHSADIAISGTHVRAVVSGTIGRPRPLVKAVTYHRASLEPVDGSWRGRVVLDV